MNSFWPPPASSRFSLVRPLYCCHNILDPLPRKTVTSFMDDPWDYYNNQPWNRCNTVIAHFILCKKLDLKRKGKTKDWRWQLGRHMQQQQQQQQQQQHPHHRQGQQGGQKNQFFSFFSSNYFWIIGKNAKIIGFSFIQKSKKK